MCPKANLNLGCVSVSEVVESAVEVVLGVILLLVAICLIIGAQKLSDAFRVL
jgi:hypothetical protein